MRESNRVAKDLSSCFSVMSEVRSDIQTECSWPNFPLALTWLS